jgi:hypothetical protein
MIFMLGFGATVAGFVTYHYDKNSKWWEYLGYGGIVVMTLSAAFGFV